MRSIGPARDPARALGPPRLLALLSLLVIISPSCSGVRLSPDPGAPLSAAQTLVNGHHKRHGGSHASTSSRPREYGTWGYVEVREGAHMFWWHEPCLKECLSQPVKEQPLILWLQGGPGASSTGYGQFEEIGLWEKGWGERKYTWLEHANILFVDSPVGTGFSYVEDDDLYATDAKQAAEDVVTMLRTYTEGHTDAKVAPLYIFCESYGGKIGTAVAVAVRAAIADGRLEANLAGLALGDSWISGAAFTSAWGDMLTALSLVDDKDMQAISTAAMGINELIDSGDYPGATRGWADMEGMVVNMTAGVSFYNVLRHAPLESQRARAARWMSGRSHAVHAWGADANPTGEIDIVRAAALNKLVAYHEDGLWEWMNGPVKEHLNRWKESVPKNVTWGGQADKVFDAMAGDFMKSVVHHVDELLAEGVPITVYNGQLDLICCTLGVEAWMGALKWKHYNDFNTADKQPLQMGGNAGSLSAFYKGYRNLQMYTIMSAGHMIPIDQPEVASEMVRQITAAKQVQDLRSRSSQDA